MDRLALLFVLMLGSLLSVPLGDRLRLPAPVLMALLGAVLALLPFVPDVDFPPELILPLVLPPLLYATVQRTSWRQFAVNVRPILLLAARAEPGADPEVVDRVLHQLDIRSLR